jgi:hypothetical protein
MAPRLPKAAQHKTIDHSICTTILKNFPLRGC